MVKWSPAQSIKLIDIHALIQQLDRDARKAVAGSKGKRGLLGRVQRLRKRSQLKQGINNIVEASGCCDVEGGAAKAVVRSIS